MQDGTAPGSALPVLCNQAQSHGSAHSGQSHSIAIPFTSAKESAFTQDFTKDVRTPQQPPFSLDGPCAECECISEQNVTCSELRT